MKMVFGTILKCVCLSLQFFFFLILRWMSCKHQTQTRTGLLYARYIQNDLPYNLQLLDFLTGTTGFQLLSSCVYISMYDSMLLVLSVGTFKLSQYVSSIFVYLLKIYALYSIAHYDDVGASRIYIYIYISFYRTAGGIRIYPYCFTHRCRKSYSYLNSTKCPI